MALTDHTLVPGSNGSVLHGPTLEIDTAETVAGDFSYGFNSASVPGSGSLCLVYTHPAFTFTLGSNINMVLTKVSTEGSGVSTFMFAGLGDGTGVGDVSESAYVLGIQNDSSNRIVLCKGPIENGCPAGEAGDTVSTTKIIARGSASIDAGTWVHLRLQAITQVGGDVVLIPQISTAALSVSAVWTTIPGMEDRYVDGVTQQLQAGPPIIIGRPGFGFAYSATGKGAAIDYMAGARQV